MNLVDRLFAIITEGKATEYGTGNKYTARVYQNRNGMHVAKFFKNGKHMELADYEHRDPKEVHEFAQDEVEWRKKDEAKNKSSVYERITEPQGHKETADKITDDSKEGTGRVKKQMGNRTPLEIIAKILSKG
jgi:hypothetical protein